MDAAALVDTLSWSVLIVCALAFVLGAIGGAINQRSEPAPLPAADGAPVTTAPVPLFRRATIGGVAAVGVLYLTNPDTGIALVGGSIAAGYAGQAVLASLESRAVAMLAVADATQAKRDVKEVVAATDVLVGPEGGGDRIAPSEAQIKDARATIARVRARHGSKT